MTLFAHVEDFLDEVSSSGRRNAPVPTESTVLSQEAARPNAHYAKPVEAAVAQLLPKGKNRTSRGARNRRHTRADLR
jgi:hypothetical protein